MQPTTTAKRSRIVAILIVIGLLASACTGSSASTTTTTRAPTTTQTTTSSVTTTMIIATLCERDGAGMSLELDGLPPAERVVLGSLPDGRTEIAVCEGTAVLTSAVFDGPAASILGAVDVDDVAPLEILIATETDLGPAVRLARTTLRGLEVTDPVADRWIDAPYDGDTLFTAQGFECADLDDDGARELLLVRYRPADNPGFEQGERLINVRVDFFVDDGATIVNAGFDVFEIDVADAYARYSDDARCEPGASARIEVRFGTNGWGLLDAGDTFAGRGDSLMAAIASDPETGVSVGVGSETPSFLIGDFFDPKPAIWWSDDRVAWNRIDLGDAIGELRDVTVLPDGGFLAIGSQPEGAVAWVSADGLTWERFAVPSGSDDVAGQLGPVMSGVAVTPWGIVAVGMENYAPTEPTDFTPSEDLDPALWLSPDGRTWERVEDPAFGSVGYQHNEGDEFNGEIIDVTFFPEIGIVAVGSASESDPTIDYPDQTPAVWVSPDGVTWQRHDIDVDARLRGVVASTSGVAVFGLSDVSGSPTSDGVILTSVDGATWTKVDGPFAGLSDSDGIQSMNDGVAIPGIGIAVLGSDEAELEVRGGAAVWWSDDGLGIWQREVHDSATFGVIDSSPAFTMTGGDWDGSMFVVVGFSGREIVIPGGATGCCLYEPAVWMWDPARVRD